MENTTLDKHVIDFGEKTFGEHLAEYVIIMFFLCLGIYLLAAICRIIVWCVAALIAPFKKQPEKITTARLHNETWFYEVVGQEDNGDLLLENGEIVTKEDLAEYTVEKQNV